MPVTTKISSLASVHSDDRGILQISIAKLTYADDQLVERGNHSAMLIPGMDIGATIAGVNANLVDQGYTALSVDDVAAIQSAADTTWTLECIAAYQAGNAVPPEQRVTAVDMERDRRTSAGFAFGGKVIQSRRDDLLKITGAATAATIAVTVGGKQAGDLRWSDPNADFVWIAADNTTLPMGAPTTIQFGQAALAHVAANVFAARSIKDRIIAGEDLDPTDDALWPQ